MAHFNHVHKAPHVGALMRNCGAGNQICIVTAIQGQQVTMQGYCKTIRGGGKVLRKRPRTVHATLGGCTCTPAKCSGCSVTTVPYMGMYWRYTVVVPAKP